MSAVLINGGAVESNMTKMGVDAVTPQFAGAVWAYNSAGWGSAITTEDIPFIVYVDPSPFSSYGDVGGQFVSEVVGASNRVEVSGLENGIMYYEELIVGQLYVFDGYAFYGNGSVASSDDNVTVYQLNQWSDDISLLEFGDDWLYDGVPAGITNGAWSWWGVSGTFDTAGYYQGWLVNGTLDDGSTFSFRFATISVGAGMNSADLTVKIMGGLVGDTYYGSWVNISQYPTVVNVRQSSAKLYSLSGVFMVNGSYSGDNVFTIARTQISQSSLVATIGTYTNVSASTYTASGDAFVCPLAFVNSNFDVVYVAYKVYVLMSNGTELTYTYKFAMYKSGVAPPLDPTGSPVFPSPSPDGDIGGAGDGTWLDNGVVLFVIALMFVFLPPMLVVVAVPKVGLFGFMLVMGCSIGLGVWYLGLPFYFLILGGIGLLICFYGLLKRG